MSGSFPVLPADLTADWLTEQLRSSGAIRDSRVTGITLSALGEGVGMMALLTRVHLDYDRPEEGAPASVVAKFAAQNEGNRAVAMAFRIYEREALFLRDIVRGTGVPVPDVYAVEIDPASGDFVIVMEDVGRYHMGDQVLGCGPDEARMILDAIAPLHAAYWGRVGGAELSFIPHVDGDMQRDAMSDACAAGWDPCLERFPEQMTPAVRAVRDRFLAAVKDLHDRMGRLTQTVIHGDVRLDNIMFGRAEDHHPLVILDWQGVLISAAAQDVAYLLTQNLTTEHRREWERDLLAHYHSRLVEHGVTGYSLEQLWEDYRLAALYLFIYAVVIGGTLDPSNERGLAFMMKLMERATAAIEDLGLFSIL